jgi:Amt family ammonium transporter
MFQMTFAIITPGLIIGAFVERIKFSAVMLFSGLWLIVVYAPAVHWVWAGSGWMFNNGTIDLAGGIVVHATAGISALVLAKMLGPRNGFPKKLMPPHSPGLVMMGAALLWVGWFGFNAGSQLAAGGSAGMTMLVTHISAAMASLTWMVVEKIKTGKTWARWHRYRNGRRPCIHHPGIWKRRTNGRHDHRSARRYHLLLRL